MIINTSVFNLVNHNALRLADKDIQTRFKRLSSGLKINKGVDDPSGLAISMGMKGQIRGYDVAVHNCQDGINLLRTMDGGMEEIHDLLLRMRDSAVRAANEAVLTTDDRTKLNDEVLELADEITRTAEATTFNGKHVLIGDAETGGYKIAFISNRDGNWEMYTMNSDGSNQVNITNNAAQDTAPRWSPDGSKIGFVTTRDGNSEIYVMNSDGSNQVNITNNAASDEYFAWSPDGSKIAFSSNRDGGLEIYVMNSDGSNPVRLTNNFVLDLYPTWSPDGSKIAFERNVPGLDREIFVMDSDGSNQVNITNNAASDSGAAWSPDGSKIAFSTWRDGNPEIYVMNSDGSNLVRLTNDLAVDGMPAWSPDGSQIVFVKGVSGVFQEVYIMNSDGSNPVNITNNPASTDWMPSWGGVSDKVQVLQVGPDNGENYRIQVTFPDARADAIGVSGVNVSAVSDAQNAIEAIDSAITKISEYRNYAGQLHRRVEHIVDDNKAAYINISAARSRIEDADFAEEITALAKTQITSQSTQAMAAVANSEPRMILELINRNI